jgi:hypothetical protein
MQRTAGRFAARLNEELRIMKPKTLSPAVADLVFVRPFAMHRSNVTAMALALISLIAASVASYRRQCRPASVSGHQLLPV